MNRSIVCLAALVSGAILSGCGRCPPPAANPAPTGTPAAAAPAAPGTIDEKAMAEAVTKAVASFDDFLARFRSPQPGDTNFCVKVRIIDGNRYEDFWIKNPKLEAEPYSGMIANEPGTVTNVTFKQDYAFFRTNIVDWMYRANGKVQGNYTLPVILKSLPPEEADAIRRDAGW
jgi:uncharacterized protein YegJ (DUF2314 family)